MTKLVMDTNESCPYCPNDVNLVWVESTHPSTDPYYECPECYAQFDEFLKDVDYW